jgi:hypothetical protein
VIPDLKTQVCSPLYEALEQHEKVHQDSCSLVWHQATTRFPGTGPIEAKQGQWVINFWDNPERKAADEVRAYQVQLQMMRDSMRKLAAAKGCGVDTESIAPPPSKDFLHKVDQQARMLSDKLKKARGNTP